MAVDRTGGVAARRSPAIRRLAGQAVAGRLEGHTGRPFLFVRQCPTYGAVRSPVSLRDGWMAHPYGDFDASSVNREIDGDSTAEERHSRLLWEEEVVRARLIIVESRPLRSLASSEPPKREGGKHV